MKAMEYSLNFVVEPFSYNIIFSQSDESIFIEATHVKEYFVWEILIHEQITSGHNSESFVDVKLTPEIIFKILSDYHNGTTRGNEINIIFPKSYKAQNAQIFIEFHFSVVPSIKKYNDSKIIILDPKIISYDDRIDKVITYRENKSREEILSKCDELIKHSEFILTYNISSLMKKIINDLKKNISNESISSKKNVDDITNTLESIKLQLSELDQATKSTICGLKIEFTNKIMHEFKELREEVKLYSLEQDKLNKKITYIELEISKNTNEKTAITQDFIKKNIEEKANCLKNEYDKQNKNNKIHYYFSIVIFALFIFLKIIFKIPF